MDINSTIRRVFQGRMLEYELKPCKESYVSEALDQEIEHWTNHQPILINAPTGSGKSRFVLKNLADYAAKSGRWILVLSNRIALNMQQKLDLCCEKELPIAGTKILVDCHEFGNVVLCTYQSSSGLIEVCCQQSNWYQLKWSRGEISDSGQFPPYPYSPPQFVVFDEAHFFGSDAVFNPQTEAILENTLFRFPDSIRIYMSATPSDVKPIMAEKEYRLSETKALANPQMKLYQLSGKNKIIEYHFSANYDFIRLKFFYEWKTVEERILEEKDSTDKWLIFVNSKETGKQVRDKLTKQLASFIDADDNKSKIRQLTRAQCFDDKVLVSTSVIDNGINIWDDDLKNLVLDFSDEVQLIQMIGRKRIKAHEQVNVYVRVPSVSEIGTYRRGAEHLIDELHAFERSPGNFFKKRWGKLDERTQKLFAVYPMGAGINFGRNGFTEYQLALMCGKYEELEDKALRNEYAYAEQVCEWLQKKFDPAMCLDKNRDAEALEALGKFLDMSVEKEISSDRGEDKISELDELSKQMIELLSTSQRVACKIRAGASRSKRNVEKILEYFGLPYKLVKLDVKKFCMQKSISIDDIN